MWRAFLVACVPIIACGGKSESNENPLYHCDCGAALRASETAESFDEKFAELSEIACNGVPAFQGECSDGKRFLYINGGFGHTALYYVDQHLIGSSRSSDIYAEGCPWSTYGGALEDVTCEILSAEPLCPTGPFPRARELSEPLTIPYADGQLWPWCGPQ